MCKKHISEKFLISAQVLCKKKSIVCTISYMYTHGGGNLTISYDEEQISLPLGDVVILRDFKKPESLKTVIGALHWSLIAYLYFKIRKICLGKACKS